MSENPFQAVLKATESLSRCVQSHLSRLFPAPQNHQQRSSPPLPFLSSKHSALLQPTDAASPMKKSATPLTKEELGRATWTLLHTIAAQMAILSRLYPCKECADHFKEILKFNPVQADSQAEFSQWLCHVHNIVNRRLGKLIFPCNRINARWGKLDCKDRACDLQWTTDFNNRP